MNHLSIFPLAAKDTGLELVLGGRSITRGKAMTRRSCQTTGALLGHPFADLLIGATALSLGYSMVTVNRRDFNRIPGLTITQLT
jgi:predicted nucleic acid-binding protein